MLRLGALRNLSRLKNSGGLNNVHRQPVIYRLCVVPLSTKTKFDISKDNIILMGSPGCGKSTVGEILSKKLGADYVDVNEYLGSYWNMSVTEKLSKLGSDEFLQAEGEGLLKLNVSKSVVALSGSNPMHSSSMKHMSQTGLIVYLDVKTSDILEHLQNVEVNCIVGQEAGIPLEEIVLYRQQFYERNYDLRITCGAYESPEAIAQKVLQAVNQLDRNEGYVSTRADLSSAVHKTFNDVVLEGFSPDGGLYVPAGSFPYLSEDQWMRLVPMTCAERAQRILEQWIIPSDVHPSDLSKMVNAAYAELSFPIQKLYQDKLHNSEYILELFHGPTASVKDCSSQLAPKLFQHAANKANTSHRYLMLVAVSGDTGGAILDGFSKLEGSNVAVIVLYPEDGISDIQKAQMTSVQSPNVKVIGVGSDLDYCQTAVKAIFDNKVVQEELLVKYNCKLSAGDSVNWGQLLPQVVQHASGYLDLVKLKKIRMGQEVDLCVPTGSFTNMLAAYYARQMGIPYRYLICASNVNNILTEFFNTGHYAVASRQLHKTSSPAIDILKSTNLERFLFHVLGQDSNKVCNIYQTLEDAGYFAISKQDLKRIQRLILADWCMEGSAGRCIKKIYEKTGYLMDPYTALAKMVANKFEDDQVPMIIVSTSHYAKCAPDVLASLGHEVNDSNDFKRMFRELERLPARPAMHETLKQNILKPAVHNTIIQPTINNIVSEIKTFLSV